MYYSHDVSIRLIYVEKHANADQQSIATIMFPNIYGGRQCILVDESPKTETQSQIVSYLAREAATVTGLSAILVRCKRNSSRLSTLLVQVCDRQQAVKNDEQG